MKEVDGRQLIGMDFFDPPEARRNYVEQQLPGSAYYISDQIYEMLINAIACQLARAGFRILVAHGHGPSTQQFNSMRSKLLDLYGLRCFSCFFDYDEENWREIGFQVDHGASNETSIVMACRPDLVDMTQISAPEGVLPKGLAGVDPRSAASAQIGEKAFAYTADRMERLLREELLHLKK